MENHNCARCIYQSVCPSYEVTMPDCKNYFPIGDVVPVTRCKNCVYCYYDEKYGRYWCNRMFGTFRVRQDGFCSFAIKKERDVKK